MAKPGCYVVAAGGTGGHLFPAQALAKALLARGHRVVLMTDKRFLAFKAGFGEVEVQPVLSGKLGGSPIAKAKGLLQIVGGIWQAAQALRVIAPQAVIGFGGYPSFPTMMAASVMQLPTLLHEQNVLMGKTNRFMAKHVRLIAASFRDMAGLEAALQTKVRFTGNPVRPAIAALHDAAYVAPEPGGPIRLLVTGGSQGASVFGKVLPEAIVQLPDAVRRRLTIHQQSRADDSEATQAQYDAIGVAATVRPFFENMQELLAHAHLVICRSGASTIAELTVAGRPAIYVPYPYAAEDHQRLNAEAVAPGPEWVIDERNFTADAVAARLAELFTDNDALIQAANHAKSLAVTDAAEQLADLAESLAAPTKGAAA